MNAQRRHVCNLIIGSGPAGYSAAIYAARADLMPVLYTGVHRGGQLTTTGDIENYPGYPDGILGAEMMENFRRQAERMGTDIQTGFISAVDFSKRPYKLTVNETEEVLADTVIIATGARPKWLGLESEKRYAGAGVSACATCDGFFFRGQEVAIVGGGDTATEEALHLANLCPKVYLIVRKQSFTASKIMIHRVEKRANIEILYNTEVLEIRGDDKKVNGVIVLNNKTGVKHDLPVAGFFVAIGHHPDTDMFRKWLSMDDDGYILTGPDSTATNLEGVFCCGDAQDKIFRQAVVAAGSGCMAALECERYLLTTGAPDNDLTAAGGGLSPAAH
jgi:thioredoxin reductase (NADPH)